MKTIRVAILADYREEKWPSMDLVAEMLAQHLLQVQDPDVTLLVDLICPPMKVRFFSGNQGLTRNADRLINRFFDYPRYLRTIRKSFDLFHIADHSYSQLAHELPPGRVVVSCHDVDTFRCLWEQEGRGIFFRAMTRRILSGIKKAAHVFCDSESTRNEVLLRKIASAEKCSVVLNGLRPHFGELNSELKSMPKSNGPSDVYILHVGSTIPRKRIEFLLDLFRDVQREIEPNAKLIRVGGPFTEAQKSLVNKRGIGSSIEIAPFLSTRELADIYSKATLLVLTSDAEGFGFPIIEALSRGTPVLASDIPVLREVGGPVTRFAPVGDKRAWLNGIRELLKERNGPDWQNFQMHCREHAAQFSWSDAAQKIVEIYKKIIR